MIRTVLLLASIHGLVRCSGVHEGALSQLAPVAAIGPGAPIAEVPAPVVTAASSQYFHRTFNRLVVPSVVAPVAPPPPQPIIPVAPAPAVFVEPTRTVPIAVDAPTQAVPIQPNVAIAIATAHAAAPVATILLPPYPFGFPPNIGFIPSEQPINVPDENNKEPTTQSTTQAEVTKSEEPEVTTPVPSNGDNSFALPSNVDINTINTFKQYGSPALPSDGQGQQFQPNQPHPQFQPNQPRPQFQPNQPRPQFQPNQPRPQFQPLPMRPQFQPQQPEFPPQKPQPQFPPQQLRPQFPPQQLRPQFPPQQPRPQLQPVQQPQQHRPQYPPQQQLRPMYQAPQQPWPQHKAKPQKLKTSVEVVPVPLAYITPPPLHKTHAHLKTVKHFYTYIPVSSSKIVLKPVKVRSVRLVKVIKSIPSQNLRANARDFEITTVNPFPRPNTKPPRV